MLQVAPLSILNLNSFVADPVPPEPAVPVALTAVPSHIVVPLDGVADERVGATGWAANGQVANTVFFIQCLQNNIKMRFVIYKICIRSIYNQGFDIVQLIVTGKQIGRAHV